MTVVHAFDPPERFVAGTVGPPGQRTFYLQAKSGPRVVSVALEKQFVAALAQRIDELLDSLATSQNDATVIPAIAPRQLTDDAPLETPVEEEFRAGAMTLSWDPDEARVVIEVLPATAEDDVDPTELMLVRLSPGSARAFAERANRVVEAGRPGCPFCTEPIDPEGHLCVRANGFRRHG